MAIIKPKNQKALRRGTEFRGKDDAQTPRKTPVVPPRKVSSKK